MRTILAFITFAILFCELRRRAITEANRCDSARLKYDAFGKWTERFASVN